MIKDEIIVTGNRAIARSHAKINLTLDVLGRRSDGYHDVEMIMQTVSLFDLILVDKIPGGIFLSTNLKYLPLGADVPYCITGGTQLSCGIGERLTPLHSPQPFDILMVKPFLNISTAAVYEAIDSAEISKRPDTAAMADAIAKNDLREISANLCNVMESVTERLHPIIRGIKTKMLSDGALGALMSGSGPTVFGIFDDYGKAYKSYESFSYQFKDTFLVKTYN